MRRSATARRILIAAPSFRPWDLGTYVELALGRLGIDSVRFAFDGHVSRRAAGVAFGDAVASSRADAVIGLKLDGLPASSVSRIRKAGVRVLLWQVDAFDDRVPDWIVPLLPAVDVVAVTAHGLRDAYAALTPARVEWVMEGAWLPAFPDLPLTRGERRTFGSEVAFIGNLAQPPVADRRLAGRRTRLLRRLSRHFQTKVWGPQRPEVIAARWPPGLTLVRWPAYNEDYVRVSRASASVLGINTVNTVRQYFSNRTFLTLASGGFHLTHHVPGLEELFGNHEHLVWYHDDAECEALCRHYLARPAARRRIAEAGRLRARRRWSLTRQVSRLVDLIGDRDAA